MSDNVTGVEGNRTYYRACDPTNQESNLMEKPQRPPSAFNLFFQQECDAILGNGFNHQRAVNPSPEGSDANEFAALARTIVLKWRNLDDRMRDHFEQLAVLEHKAYQERLKRYKTQLAFTVQQYQNRYSRSSSPRIVTSGQGMIHSVSASSDEGLRTPFMDRHLRRVPSTPSQPIGDLAQRLDSTEVDFVAGVFDPLGEN